MKGVSKGKALGIMIPAILALLAWGGNFLYWHVRIHSAIRTLETQPTGPEGEAALTELISAGCRSLPYLISALDPSKEGLRQWEILYLVFGWTASAT
jgi:hypothetical protein